MIVFGRKIEPYANLSGADLHGADLSGATLPNFQIPQGVDLIVYKNISCGVVSKLLVPKEAKRTASLMGNKCRAEYVKVLEGEGCSKYDPETIYKVGKIVRPDSYDDDIRVECTHGIHFFMSEKDAIEWPSY